MANTVEKGITIVFRGDTAKFDDAVKNVNRELKGVKDELYILNKELKLDPTNFDKLSKKLDTLKEKEKKLNEEIDAYRLAMSKMDKDSESFKQSEIKCRELALQVEYTRKEIEKMGGTETGIKLNLLADKFDGISKKVGELGKAFAPLSALASAGLGASTKVASDFESKMSQVNATMGITKETTIELNGELVNTNDVLSELALEMGSKTAFSASECAEALNYLALAGYDVEQMAETLPVVLNLASAGGIGLANASDMVTDAMSALGLGVEDAIDMVDQMAKTASSSNTSVAQLGEAILSIGATAKGIKGGTIELDTALGLLANNGIKGAEAGTKLRNIILSLQNPTDKASNLMNKLNLNVYDSEGAMRGLDEILGDLNNSIVSMSEAERSEVISTIFNKADLASAQALLANVGNAWEELTEKIEDSAGSAQKMSDTQLDNLQGQLTILKSSIEGLGIQVGKVVLPLIKRIVSFVQGLLDKLNGLTDAQKRIGVAITGLIALISPMLLGFSKITDIASKLTAKLAGSGGLAKGITSLMNPLALAIIAITLMYTKSEKFRNAINSLVTTLWQELQPILEKVFELFGEIGVALETFLFPIIEVIADWLARYIIPAVTKLAEAILPVLSNAISIVVGVIQTLVDWVKSIWNYFVDLGVIEAFGNMFEWIGEKISAFIEIVKSAVEWIGNLLGKVADFFSSGWEKISNFANGNSVFGSGGFGNLAYASGGYGTLELNTTINVNNNGQNLSKYQAQQFGREIVEYVNDKLGRRI